MIIYSIIPGEEATLKFSKEDVETLKFKLRLELSSECKDTFSTDKAKILVDLYHNSSYFYLNKVTYSHYTCKIISELLGVKIL